MIRGDVQGGSMTGTGMGHSSGGGGFGGSKGGNVAIEKYMRWHWAFFGGACLVTASGVGTIVYWFTHFTFAPATALFELFLLFFGIIMLVLDTPVPHIQNHKHIQAVRYQIYKFALFMTRFMGRGIWYLFLATLVFSSLWDTGINWFLGFVCTTYLTVLGIVAIAKGVIMSSKLNRVREAIRASGNAADRYVPQGSMSTSQLKLMIESATNEQNLFTDDELLYIVNALSFSPYNDGQVTLDEMRYWLADGPQLLV